ncbi:MAG: aromatic acid decarboxylase [Candidatus Altiarchaeales archaeon HGW-Altiarchaeales-3]|nr:MAG: aromatic acid decarboxylase [Candidatus Altiarchaeales archaeon HGW-Altiarchaeales-3]
MKILIGITGATGVILGVRLLEVLKDAKGVSKTYLVISDAAEKIIAMETRYDLEYIKNLGDEFYKNSDFLSPLASGSFVSFNLDASVIVPCSMKTLSSVANGYSENLISRICDVSIKQNKKLILVPRETPLSLVHLKNMVAAKEAGAIIIPPVMGFYHKPKTLEDMIDFIVGKILDSLNLEHNLYKKWGS